MAWENLSGQSSRGSRAASGPSSLHAVWLTAATAKKDAGHTPGQQAYRDCHRRTPCPAMNDCEEDTGRDRATSSRVFSYLTHSRRARQLIAWNSSGRAIAPQRKKTRDVTTGEEWKPRRRGDGLKLNAWRASGTRFSDAIYSGYRRLQPARGSDAASLSYGLSGGTIRSLNA